MNKRSHVLLAFLAATLLLVAVPETAHAYGGPGSVVSGIGTLLAVLAAVLASVFGFLWFPLKRLFKRITAKKAKTEAESE